MIESSTAIAPTTRDDAGFKAWTASGKKAVMRLDPSDRTAGPIPTFGGMVHQTGFAAQSLGQAYAPAQTGPAADTARPDITYGNKDDDGYDFGDVVDVINPLQHLPVIGTFYRKWTGDTIRPMSSIIGSALFGGPIGAVASTINACVKGTTGRDVTENAFSMFGLDVTPSSAKKPDLSFDSPIRMADANNLSPAASAAKTANAAYLTADGHRNFAARHASIQNWNA